MLNYNRFLNEHKKQFALPDKLHIDIKKAQANNLVIGAFDNRGNFVLGGTKGILAKLDNAHLRSIVTPYATLYEPYAVQTTDTGVMFVRWSRSDQHASDPSLSIPDLHTARRILKPSTSAPKTFYLYCNDLRTKTKYNHVTLNDYGKAIMGTEAYKDMFKSPGFVAITDPECFDMPDGNILVFPKEYRFVSMDEIYTYKQLELLETPSLPSKVEFSVTEDGNIAASTTWTEKSIHRPNPSYYDHLAPTNTIQGVDPQTGEFTVKIIVERRYLTGNVPFGIEYTGKKATTTVVLNYLAQRGGKLLKWFKRKSETISSVPKYAYRKSKDPDYQDSADIEGYVTKISQTGEIELREHTLKKLSGVPYEKIFTPDGLSKILSLRRWESPDRLEDMRQMKMRGSAWEFVSMEFESPDKYPVLVTKDMDKQAEQLFVESFSPGNSRFLMNRKEVGRDKYTTNVTLTI